MRAYPVLKAKASEEWRAVKVHDDLRQPALGVQHAHGRILEQYWGIHVHSLGLRAKPSCCHHAGGKLHLQKVVCTVQPEGTVHPPLNFLHTVHTLQDGNQQRKTLKACKGVHCIS